MQEHPPPVSLKEIQEGCYLLHFDEAVPYERAHWYGDQRHYVGQSQDILHRVGQHRAGNGSKMTKTAYAHGIGIHLVGIFPTAKPRYVENLITTLGAKVYCPICSEEAYEQEKKQHKLDNVRPRNKELEKNIRLNKSRWYGR